MKSRQIHSVLTRTETKNVQREPKQGTLNGNGHDDSGVRTDIDSSASAPVESRCAEPREANGGKSNDTKTSDKKNETNPLVPLPSTELTPAEKARADAIAYIAKRRSDLASLDGVGWNQLVFGLNDPNLSYYCGSASRDFADHIVRLALDHEIIDWKDGKLCGNSAYKKAA